MLIANWLAALPFVPLYILSAFGWGLVFNKKNLDLTFAFGLGFLLTLLTAFGILHGYNIFMQGSVLFFGILFFTKNKPVDFKISLKKIEIKKEWLWLILPLLYYFVRWFSAGLPHQHSDPLYYHLSAPKLWAELGQIKIPQEHPSFAQTGIWESVFGIPLLIFKPHGLFSLVTTQIAAQWAHILIGQLGCTYFATKILVHLTGEKNKKHFSKLFFLAWLCTTLPSFEWTGGLAKNEYILLFFCLASLLACLEKRYLLSGLLSGFAFATKSLTLWYAVSLLFLIPWKDKNFKSVVWAHYIAGCMMGSFGYVFRNLIWTGNPIFPAFDNILGPGWLSSYWASHFSAGGGAFKIDLQMLPWVWEKMFEKALPKVLFLLGLGGIALELYRDRSVSRWFKNWGRWVGFLSSQLILTLLMFRPTTDGRYASVIAVLLLLFGVATLLRGVSVIKPKVWRYEFTKFSPVVLLFGLGFFINIPLDVLVKIPKGYLFQKPLLYLERFHLSHAAKNWINENTAPRDKIFFAAEKINFYIDRPFEAVAEMGKWEDILNRYKNAQDFFSGLRGLGYRYLYLNADVEYPPPLRAYWNSIMHYRKRAVFDSPTAVVFDLEKI